MDPGGRTTSVSPAATRSDISAIAYGFMASKALFAALEIGIFTVLADGPLAPVDLADRTGLAARRLRTLLHALVGLGLLVRDGDMFGNAPAADRYLVRGRAEDFGDYFRLQLGRQIYPALLHLDAGIAGTGRAFDTMSALIASPDDARTFTTAQHVGSLAAARVLADRVLPDRLPTVAAVEPSLSRSARGFRRCGPPSWTSRRWWGLPATTGTRRPCRSGSNWWAVTPSASRGRPDSTSS